MDITAQTIVGSIVAQDFETAEVFRKYKIDFCCQGNRSILEASDNKQELAQQIVTDLIHLFKKGKSATLDYKSMPLDLLVEHILDKHHRYVENQIPVLKEYLKRICNAHGFNHPELFEVSLLFNRAADELVVHMKKEELILFPYIRKIAEAVQSNGKLGNLPFGSIENPIAMMEHDHSEEGQYFSRISKLTNGYQVPADACNTYKVTMSLLQQFEEDLHLHIHLENNILFPQSVVMEKEV